MQVVGKRGEKKTPERKNVFSERTYKKKRKKKNKKKNETRESRSHGKKKEGWRTARQQGGGRGGGCGRGSLRSKKERAEHVNPKADREGNWGGLSD